MHKWRRVIRKVSIVSPDGLTFFCPADRSSPSVTKVSAGIFLVPALVCVLILQLFSLTPEAKDFLNENDRKELAKRDQLEMNFKKKVKEAKP
jgi:hypothetical protein